MWSFVALSAFAAGGEALSPERRLATGRTRRAAPRAAPTMVYAPQGSGWVEKDEDDKERRFNNFPDEYVPNLAYEGTCKPGLGRENRPFDELEGKSIRTKIAPHAFFEVPFHVRWPPNHPWQLSPYERLELAGRFAEEEDDESDRSMPRVSAEASARMTVEKLDRTAEEAKPQAEVDRDPLFDDESSLLLDAALGLGDKSSKPPLAAPEKKKKAKGKADDFLLD